LSKRKLYIYGGIEIMGEKELIAVPAQEKPKKTKASVEDKLKALLDDHYTRMEEMIDQKMENYNYRMYNSFKSEMRRWWTGYYENFEER